LSISRKFVELMGGTITVESLVGIGSCFRVVLPIRAIAEIPKPNPPFRLDPVGLAPDQRPYRIAIVDDQVENRQFLISLLSPLGLELEQATNGEEAVTLWKQWHPHLIFMDLQMPVMDGYQATEQIKATAPGQETVIIAMTDSILESEPEHILDCGCDDFLYKPLNESQIFQTLSTVIGMGFMEQEISSGELDRPGSTPLSNPALLSALPVSLVEELERATICIDLGAIQAILDQIAGYPPESQNAELALALKQRVAAFDYPSILSFIRQSKL
jgi:CheY-like chemotaxis protein